MATITGQFPQARPAVAKPIPWVALAWFTALLIIAYFPILRHLVEQWANDEDAGHGFFVPVVAALVVWQRREELLEIEWKPAWWGVWILLWGVVQSFLGTLGAELFLQRTSVLITLVGMLLVFGGTKLVKALTFPLLLLPFMIPFPAVIYNQITFPLQLFASSVAESVLGVLNIPVLRDGNVLELASQKLTVVEACSGIRSLMSLLFLSLVYSYFFDKKIWMRWALLAATVPLAILANAGRVAITGILSEEVSPDLAHGFFHSLEGWVIFVIDIVMLLAVHAVINRIYSLRSRKAAKVV
ncbi:MAG TPA: exosortase/archaeosortase family protein [Bryobacteraceae bacterium]|nr:exosortase/archaeosortase family protein [Bryobacteraceae bacterium]